MGISFGNKNFRVSVTKNGIGWSAGTKGVRVGHRANASKRKHNVKNNEVSEATIAFGHKALYIICCICFIPMFLLGLLLLLVEPIIGIISIAIGAIELVYIKKYRKTKQTKETKHENT